MSDEKLICGNCGWEICLDEDNFAWSFRCDNMNCPVTTLYIDKEICHVKAEAIAAWKLATRVDIEQDCSNFVNELFDYIQASAISNENHLTALTYIIKKIREKRAEINLPEKE